MIKRMIALVFLLAFAMQTFSRAFIVFDYFMNTKSFAKNCENKARPKMHCNGKCQMMKKLKQEEKKDEQNSERRSANKNETLSSRSFFYLITFFSEHPKNYYFIKASAPAVDRAFSIFHPPQVH